MKLIVIFLAILGFALLLWGFLGLNVVWNPPQDPPLTEALLQEFRWAATREMLLGASLVGMAWLIRRGQKAKGLADG